ncbi:transporter substrate-binding domain-containing protein [Lactococcus insecticola]|uniref:Amino acid ABC transporter substrate-binding protein n=1 Tax=Pseudolactococcus insecticola TaxID=2709158 RepID=A0A6A0B9D9_9LACT|nr:transporter substrate-binding domain-containing protein [Lactococcus insecticola]GFH41233.1 amino acid ABC transporter substrate-binding protein [Lactococcus insecticola]
MKKITKIALSFAAVLAVTSLAACGKSDDKDKTSKSSSAKVTEITVGTAGMPKPFTYKTADGKLTGYDIELAKKIDKALPQYKFKFEVTEFPSVLANLDTGRFQLAANNFGYKAERAEKYIYSDPIAKNPGVLVVKKGSDIKSWADIAGKKTTSETGTTYSNSLEEFNKTAKTKVDFTYTEADLATQLQQVSDGKLDFKLQDLVSAKQIIKESGLSNLKVIDITGERDNPNSYYLFPKDADKAFVKAVNAQIAKFKKDGTLKALSEKELGGNYAPDDSITVK